ncbi:hypothetical protein E1264_40045, partial [Actinomadura sp. KC216]|uniref:hypothetical protein n=1 Tax=Actinomadura sp. KC216 TaxID=2530370 RepID=UPI001044A665
MTTQPGTAQGGGGWAAAGPRGGDIAYRTQSLKFVPMELSLDESVPWRSLRSLFMRAFIVSFAVYLPFFFLAFIGFVVWLGSQGGSGFEDSDGSSGTGLMSMGWLGVFIASAVFWLVLLLSQTEEPIAEWRTLLENKAAAADSAYAAIYGSLARRRIPVNVTAMRIRSDILAPEVVNNRLVIVERHYSAYVSVFAYGTSLYVGWMMWRNRRGYLLIGTFIKDLVGSILGRSGLINQMLRTERVRATREAVHSAVREGVEVAVQGIEVPLAATFGQDLPIQDLMPSAA